MTDENTTPEEETISIPMAPEGLLALMRRISEDAIVDMATSDEFFNHLNLPQVMESPQALMEILIRLKITELMILAYTANITGRVVENSAEGIGVTKDMCEIVTVSMCVFNKLVDKEIAKKLYPAIRDLDNCPALGDSPEDESPAALIDAAKRLRELLSKVHLPNNPHH